MLLIPFVLLVICTVIPFVMVLNVVLFFLGCVGFNLLVVVLNLVVHFMLRVFVELLLVLMIQLLKVSFTLVTVGFVWRSP